MSRGDTHLTPYYYKGVTEMKNHAVKIYKDLRLLGVQLFNTAEEAYENYVQTIEELKTTTIKGHYMVMRFNGGDVMTIHELAI